MSNTTHTPRPSFKQRVNSALDVHGTWETAQKLLSGCFSQVFGLGSDDFPDTPEVDELRHEINDALESYKSDRNFEDLRKTLKGVREELYENMESYILG